MKEICACLLTVPIETAAQAAAVGALASRTSAPFANRPLPPNYPQSISYRRSPPPAPPATTVCSLAFGPCSKDANIKDKLEQYPDDEVPEDQFTQGATIDDSGAWTRLFVILTPADVNFGGGYDTGVCVIEKDIKSPDKDGTYSPVNPEKKS